MAFFGWRHVAGRPGWRLVVATFGEAAWELLENSPVVIEQYRAGTIALGYSGDSILNSMSDVGFMILGFTLASVLAPRVTVALGVCLELVSLIAIRDNLTLNVLMLVHPFDAIRMAGRLTGRAVVGRQAISCPLRSVDCSEEDGPPSARSRRAALRP